MKIPLLLASFAVAVMASAADLKNPALVAEDWNRAVEAALAPVISVHPFGLAVTPPAKPWTQPPAISALPMMRRNGDVVEVTPGPNLDHGFLRIVPDGGKIPPGAKPWVYRGQTFWLIPLAADGGK